MMDEEHQPLASTTLRADNLLADDSDMLSRNLYSIDNARDDVNFVTTPGNIYNRSGNNTYTIDAQARNWLIRVARASIVPIVGITIMVPLNFVLLPLIGISVSSSCGNEAALTAAAAAYSARVRAEHQIMHVASMQNNISSNPTTLQIAGATSSGTITATTTATSSTATEMSIQNIDEKIRELQNERLAETELVSLPPPLGEGEGELEPDFLQHYPPQLEHHHPHPEEKKNFEDKKTTTKAKPGVVGGVANVPAPAHRASPLQKSKRAAAEIEILHDEAHEVKHLPPHHAASTSTTTAAATAAAATAAAVNNLMGSEAFAAAAHRYAQAIRCTVVIGSAIQLLECFFLIGVLLCVIQIFFTFTQAYGPVLMNSRSSTSGYTTVQISEHDVDQMLSKSFSPARAFFFFAAAYMMLCNFEKLYLLVLNCNSSSVMWSTSVSVIVIAAVTLSAATIIDEQFRRLLKQHASAVAAKSSTLLLAARERYQQLGTGGHHHHGSVSANDNNSNGINAYVRRHERQSGSSINNS